MLEWVSWHIVGPNGKKPPKTRFKKFVKLMDHTCNSLKNCEYQANAITGKGNYVNQETST